MSQLAYPNRQPAAQVAKRLVEAYSDSSHAFWPEDFSLLQSSLIHWDRLLGARQITDSYLLALAMKQGGRFVTFDQRIRLDLVPDAGVNNLATIEMA